MGLAVASLVVAAYGVTEQQKAAKAQESAQKKANKIESRTAELENQRRARRAVAARRVQQAELIAQAEGFSDGGTNSALSGAVGSLSTQTGSNIGGASTLLAGQHAQRSALFAGQSQANKHLGRAGYASAVSGAMSTYKPRKGGGKPLSQPQKPPGIQPQVSFIKS